MILLAKADVAKLRKVILAEMGDEELRSYLERNPLKPYTAKSIRSEEALREELERVKRRGYSVDDEEHEEQVMCIACPIKDYENKVVAAISVSWPIFRFDRDDFENTVKLIKKTAKWGGGDTSLLSFIGLVHHNTNRTVSIFEAPLF